MTEEPPTTTPAISSGRYLLGIVLLLAAIGATAMLVWQHITGFAIPGCGPGSACAELAGSAWGKVPGIGWPVSHVGLAYFVAVLIGWLVSRAGLGPTFRNLIRLGGSISLMFIGVMAAKGHFCRYCL